MDEEEVEPLIGSALQRCGCLNILFKNPVVLNSLRTRRLQKEGQRSSGAANVAQMLQRNTEETGRDSAGMYTLVLYIKDGIDSSSTAYLICTSSIIKLTDTCFILLGDAIVLDKTAEFCRQLGEEGL